MADLYQNWEALDDNAILTSQTLANAASVDGSVVDMDGYTDAELVVKIIYGSPASAGVIIYLCREVADSGGAYEGISDAPFYCTAPYSTSGTHYKPIPLSAAQWRKFRPKLYNGSGAQVTVQIGIAYGKVSST